MAVPNLKPIKYTSVSKDAYARLRESILNQELVPGEQLDIAELSKLLNVSPTPVKRALDRLDLEGLVRIVPRKGSFVAELNVKEIIEVFDIRRVLETWAGESGIQHLTPERLEKLCSLVAELEGLTEPGGTCRDYLAYVKKDQMFHHLIIELCGNKKLMELYNHLDGHIQAARIYYLSSDQRAQEAQAEHQAILKALEAGDSVAFRKAIEAHLENAKSALLQRAANMEYPLRQTTSPEESSKIAEDALRPRPGSQLTRREGRSSIRGE